MTPGVVIPDRNLEAVVREVLEKPQGPLTREDLEKLQVLDATRREIEDLTGLEHCVNLTALGLGDNRTSDISPLASLANLETLSLRNNQVSDLTPLASLTRLKTLRIWYNKLRDISPLASLT